MKYVLVTGASHFNNIDIQKIADLGFNVSFLKNENEMPNIPLESIYCVICNNLFSFHEIQKFSNLELIQLTSSGLDRMPLDYIEKKGIKLFNARGVYSIPMAEFALSGILDLLKKKKFFFEKQFKHEWVKNRDLSELHGKKCLIIGCGSVGQELAKLLVAFSCRVDGVDPSTSNNILFNHVFGFGEIDNILNNYDIVILTVPLTTSTNSFFDKSKFALLKKNAILVNVSRGNVVCEKDLLEFIDRIGGAVLDVFEDEPLDKNNPLWDKENVVMSPHNSFVGENNKERLLRLVLDNLKNYVQ